MFKGFETRVKVAVLGMFANFLSAVESGSSVSDDFADVVFMAMVASEV